MKKKKTLNNNLQCLYTQVKLLVTATSYFQYKGLLKSKIFRVIKNNSDEKSSC